MLWPTPRSVQTHATLMMQVSREAGGCVTGQGEQEARRWTAPGCTKALPPRPHRPPPPRTLAWSAGQAGRRLRPYRHGQSAGTHHVSMHGLVGVGVDPVQRGVQTPLGVQHGATSEPQATPLHGRRGSLMPPPLPCRAAMRLPLNPGCRTAARRRYGDHCTLLVRGSEGWAGADPARVPAGTLTTAQRSASGAAASAPCRPGAGSCACTGRPGGSAAAPRVRRQGPPTALVCFHPSTHPPSPPLSLPGLPGPGLAPGRPAGAGCAGGVAGAGHPAERQALHQPLHAKVCTAPGGCPPPTGAAESISCRWRRAPRPHHLQPSCPNLPAPPFLHARSLQSTQGLGALHSRLQALAHMLPVPIHRTFYTLGSHQVG